MKKINLQELAFVIAVREIDATLITPEFLKYSQIVPSTWEVAGQSERSFQGSRVTFQNGVTVIAQPQRISFAELAVDRSPAELENPKLAAKLVDVLPNLSFVGVGVNLRGYIDFGTDRRQVRDFMFQNLLSPGAWQQLGDAPVQANVNLSYVFNDRRLNLNISEATLQTAENPNHSIVLFAGNFDYDLINKIPSVDHPQHLKKIILNWEKDLVLYREVIDRFMLSSTSVLFPT
jgi:hypothetical protein